MHSAPSSASNLPKSRNVWEIDPIGESGVEIVNMKHKKTTKQNLLILSQVDCMDVENKWLFVRVDLSLCIEIDSNQNELNKSPLLHISLQKYKKT